MTDPGLSEDQIVQILAYALMAAHIGVLIWFWFRRKIAPVLALNLLVSGGVMVYWAPRVGELFHYVDEVAAFVAFELVVFLTSVAAIFVVRVPRAVIWAAFAVNMILLAGAIYFILTFKLTRLI
jgi:hypothetical protein